MQQALRTQDKLTGLAATAVQLAGALGLIRHGVAVVEARHMLTSLNLAAERILRAEDGLCVRSGRIVASSAHAEHQLQLAIRDA